MDKEKVALKVGAICIGNGGGQSGVALYKEGVDVILLNTSSRDLSSEVVPDGVNSYIIQDTNDTGRGAGRNREIAKKLFEDFMQSEKLLTSEHFESFVREKDVIFVIASSAGGTGSGIAPTLSYLINERYPNKVIIIIGILPRLSESINSQQNSIQFFKEIEEMGEVGVKFPYALFDLEKYADLDIEEAYSKVAKDVVSMVKVIRGDYSMLTKYGMVDERNMLTMISCPGLMTVFAVDAVKQSDIKEHGVQRIILDKLTTNSNVDAQNDKISKYMGLFLEIDESIDDPVKKSIYDDIFNVTGEPFEIFVNYGIAEKPTGSFGVMLTGRTTPYDRLSKAIDRVENHEKARKDKEYSINEASKSFMDYAQNDNVDKILGSSNTKPNTTSADKPRPTFMKSRLG